MHSTGMSRRRGCAVVFVHAPISNSAEALWDSEISYPCIGLWILYYCFEIKYTGPTQSDREIKRTHVVKVSQAFTKIRENCGFQSNITYYIVCINARNRYVVTRSLCNLI